MKSLVLALSMLITPVFASVTITPNVPTYNFQVLAGSTRQINVALSGGVANTVNWSVLSTTGGATANFTTPALTNVATVAAGLPTVQVNIGAAAGNCSTSGGIGTYKVNSSATVTVQAQSTDDTSKSTTFLFNVCANTTKVLVAPAYRQAYEKQHVSLQSWITGNTDETGIWSIVTQPSGGNGKLVDTTNRDADFFASVPGRYTLQYTSRSDSSKSATAIVYVTAASLPAYPSTPNLTEPRACAVDPAFTGAVYDVGAGKPYPTMQSVPVASAWVPGTIMRIWNTDTTGSNPSTFHEYFQIHNSGTAAQPIILCGVPDSEGNLPIVDGANATAQSGTSTAAAAGLGVISLWGGGYGTNTPYGYYQSGSAGPSYVSVSGLHIVHGTPAYSFTPPAGGAATPWGVGTACLNIRSGSYVDLGGNDLDTCTNGIFTAENTNSAWAPVTQLVTIVGNHIRNSGWASDYTEHQVYFQSFFGVMQGNRLDSYLNTAEGSGIKWRGVEGIFRYNYIASGTQRDFDLVENQDASPYVSFEDYLSNPGQTNCATSLYCLGDTAGANVLAGFQESAQKDFVYGNLIFGASSQYQIHYAEDHDGQMADRNGVLYFFSNTLDGARVVFDTGSANGYNPFFTQRIDARNNLLWNTTTSGAAANQTEFGRYASIILNATTNLMRAGTFSIATPINGGSFNAGTSNGWESTCDGACQWPLTIPINSHQYGLTSANYLSTSTMPYNSTSMVPVSGSAAIGTGTPLIGVLVSMPVRWQYSASSSALLPRADVLTIGAVDTGSTGSTPTVSTPTFSPGTGTYSSSQSISIESSTPNADIHYTTDGSTPTSSSPTYSGPVSVTVTTTLQSIAMASGYIDSSVGSAVVTISSPTAASTPTFALAPGTYTTAVNVVLADATAGATIYYTTNGATPTTSSTVYTGAFVVSTTATIQAFAVAPGFTNSAVASATYTIQAQKPAATPVFSLASGTYTSAQTISLSDATAGATIYYTTNGAIPTTSSAVYSGPIVISATVTVQAIAAASGYTNSVVASATYTIQAQKPAATPVFSVASGTYTSAQTISLSDATAGAVIYYTTNGSTPTTSSAVYSGPIVISTTTTVQAIAAASGYTNSAVASATYTIQSTTAPAPTFSVAPGTYSSPQTVAILDALSYAKIFYTTDGSTPTTNSNFYLGPIVVSRTTTLKAFVVADALSNSGISSATYTIQAQKTAATPVFSVASGTYTSAQTISLSDATAGATIYYTTNGSTPTTSSAVYSGPIVISTTATVQAIAVAPGFTNSAVASATYTIQAQKPTATPAFSVASGTYTSAQTISLSDATAGAVIYYTTNGSTPTTSSAVYSGPIVISATTTVQAIAAASGSTNSAVASATYTIQTPKPAAAPVFSLASGSYTSAQTISLSDATAGAVIYYTTNGSTPTTSSMVYSGPIAVSTSTTVQAIAAASGYTNSAVASATYTIQSAAAPAPTFSVAPGTYSSSQTVAILDALSYAKIFYTTDGSTPTTNSTFYLGPIVVSSTTTLKAFVVADALSNSGISSATYTIQSAAAPAPTFSVAPGTYSSSQRVAILDALSYAKIFYTTDGTTPTTNSNFYLGPIVVSRTTTLKAFVVADALSNSGISSATYTIQSKTAPAPTFSVAPGTYSSSQRVAILDALSYAKIFYTTDGSTPTTNSTFYLRPIRVAVTTTIKAFVVATGYTDSAVDTGVYTIN